jgi:hypothetical protein
MYVINFGLIKQLLNLYSVFESSPHILNAGSDSVPAFFSNSDRHKIKLKYVVFGFFDPILM